MRALTSVLLGIFRLVLVMASVVALVFAALNVPDYLDAQTAVTGYDSMSFEEKVVFDVALSLDPQAQRNFTEAKENVATLPETILISFGISIGLFVLQHMLGVFHRYNPQPKTTAPVVVVGGYPMPGQAIQAMPQAQSVYQPPQQMMTAPPTQPPPPKPAANWQDSQQPIPLDDLNT